MNHSPAGIERQSYPLRSRILSVLRVEDLSPDMRRITLAGDDLEATLPFGQFSPTDHVKLAIPHPVTGEVVLPTFGEKGISRPDGVALREYTIRSFDATHRELAIDFVLHEHGPAGRWASATQPGDALGVMGPRGSQVYPSTYGRYVLAADETALPATERWLEEAPADSVLDVFVMVHDRSRERAFPTHTKANLRWLHRADGDDLAAEVRKSLPAADANTFVWAAAEATSLLPLRRHLRNIGFHRQSMDIRGYWKLGEAEHHEPRDAHDAERHGAAE